MNGNFLNKVMILGKSNQVNCQISSMIFETDE